jgi:Protein of unknown function (DUF1579)
VSHQPASAFVSWVYWPRAAARARALAVALLAGPALAAAAAPPATAGTAALPASVRLALPGEQHRWLEALLVQWDVDMKVWVAPGQAPLHSTALRAERRWTLGGRYLIEELDGRFEGNAASRVATLSYNYLDDRWELSTVDTFEPGQMWYASQRRGTPQRFEVHGESTEAGMGPEPTGRKRNLRFEFEILGPDRNVQRIYSRYPGGPEQLFVEQVFTRRAR